MLVQMLHDTVCWSDASDMFWIKPLQHNQDRKHRTYVYTLIVTETLEDWEDSVNIGKRHLTVALIHAASVPVKLEPE